NAESQRSRLGARSLRRIPPLSLPLSRPAQEYGAAVDWPDTSFAQETHQPDSAQHILPAAARVQDPAVDPALSRAAVFPHPHTHPSTTHASVHLILKSLWPLQWHLFFQ